MKSQINPQESRKVVSCSKNINFLKQLFKNISDNFLKYFIDSKIMVSVSKYLYEDVADNIVHKAIINIKVATLVFIQKCIQQKQNTYQSK